MNPAYAEIFGAPGTFVGQRVWCPTSKPPSNPPCAIWRTRAAAPLVVTTGGTGPAARDVTPEATRAVLDKELPGFGEIMRVQTFAIAPTAILAGPQPARAGARLDRQSARQTGSRDGMPGRARPRIARRPSKSSKPETRDFQRIPHATYPAAQPAVSDPFRPQHRLPADFRSPIGATRNACTACPRATRAGPSVRPHHRRGHYARGGGGDPPGFRNSVSPAESHGAQGHRGNRTPRCSGLAGVYKPSGSRPTASRLGHAWPRDLKQAGVRTVNISLRCASIPALYQRDHRRRGCKPPLAGIERRAAGRL